MQRKLVFVCLVCHLAVAQVSPSAFAQNRSGPVEVIVDDVGGSFEIPVPIGGETWVKFPHEISGNPTLASLQRNPRIAFDYHGSNLRIRPERDVTSAAKAGAVNVNLDAGAAHYSFRAYVVDAPHKPPPYYIVRTRSASEAREADIQARLVTERATFAAENERQARLARAEQFFAYDLIPVTKQPASDRGTVHVRLERGGWGDGDFFAKFELTNKGTAPYRFGTAVALSEHKQIEDVDVLLDLPSSDDKRAAVIQPGKSVTGVVILPNVTPNDIAPMTFMFSGPNGAHPVIVAAQEWLIPVSPEEVKAERDRLREELAQERAMRARQDAKELEDMKARQDARDLEDGEQASAEAGKVSIQLQAIGGAIWLGNGLVGSEQAPEATSLQGLGVRVTSSFNRFLAVEAEAMGAGSGAASFEDTEVNGVQGDLMRTASLGRVQFGGVLRFGQRVIPILRIGVGLQGAGYDSELTTTTEPVPMTDSGLEFTTTLNFGAGLDVRLGDHFIAGFAACVSEPLKTNDGRAIQAGIHAGYAWKP